MASLFGLIDTTRDERLHPWLLASPYSACLFAGPLDPVLLRASPYIVRLDEGSPLLTAWRSEGWGRSWGIQCVSQAGLPELHRHFRHFLQAKLPDGRIVLFRFYDPRVWRVYLPTCNEAEREMWFDEVDEFICEDEDGAGTLRFRRDAGG
jgi:hypothetical protein